MTRWDVPEGKIRSAADRVVAWNPRIAIAVVVWPRWVTEIFYSSVDDSWRCCGRTIRDEVLMMFRVVNQMMRDDTTRN
jgi:hypothetical protein